MGKPVTICTMAPMAPLCQDRIMNLERKTTDKQIKKTRKKKDNSTPADEFVNCRCCGVYIYGGERSTSDKRYCMECA